MTDIVWEEPPTRIRGTARSTVWPDRLAPLRERPSQWARIYGPMKTAAQTVTSLRAGQRSGVDPTEFEFVCRTLDDGKYIYARYIGNGSA